ncbi:Uncharacterised protein at_DN2639 [Pycnogonum litorale]
MSFSPSNPLPVSIAYDSLSYCLRALRMKRFHDCFLIFFVCILDDDQDVVGRHVCRNEFFFSPNHTEQCGYYKPPFIDLPTSITDDLVEVMGKSIKDTEIIKFRRMHCKTPS